jgi:raffinose/stachyose/melibiose transport system permease protein
LTLIPLYVLLHDMHLLGTYWSMIVVYVGGQLPFTIFLFAGFMRSLPRDYEEAALVDGAGTMRVIFSIVLPLIRPIVGTVVCLDSVYIWNDFLVPLLYLSGSPHQTLAVSIYEFTGQYFEEWNLIFAGVVIAAVPMVAVFVLLQKSFLKSFAGVLKG